MVTRVIGIKPGLEFGIRCRYCDPTDIVGREMILVSPVEIPSPMRIMTNEKATP